MTGKSPRCDANGEPVHERRADHNPIVWLIEHGYVKLTTIVGVLAALFTSTVYAVGWLRDRQDAEQQTIAQFAVVGQKMETMLTAMNKNSAQMTSLSAAVAELSSQVEDRWTRSDQFFWCDDVEDVNAGTWDGNCPNIYRTGEK